MSVQAVQDDVALHVVVEIMDAWLARQPTVSAALRVAYRGLTTLLNAAWGCTPGQEATGEGVTTPPSQDHIGAFVATFDELSDEGRHLADCGIHDRGLTTMPDWIDWQCFIAETYARGKARKHGMPAHIGTLAAAVICAALRDEATERYVAAHAGNTTLQ